MSHLWLAASSHVGLADAMFCPERFCSDICVVCVVCHFNPLALALASEANPLVLASEVKSLASASEVNPLASALASEIKP